jgi:hypothetical protein
VRLPLRASVLAEPRNYRLKSSTQLHLIPNSNLLVSGGASGPASSTCSVLDLPVEVVDYVLEDLSVMDLCSVGLVSQGNRFANLHLTFTPRRTPSLPTSCDEAAFGATSCRTSFLSFPCPASAMP